MPYDGGGSSDVYRFIAAIGIWTAPDFPEAILVEDYAAILGSSMGAYSFASASAGGMLPDRLH